MLAVLRFFYSNTRIPQQRVLTLMGAWGLLVLVLTSATQSLVTHSIALWEGFGVRISVWCARNFLPQLIFVCFVLVIVEILSYVVFVGDANFLALRVASAESVLVSVSNNISIGNEGHFGSHHPENIRIP
jgi:hypothetical protein